MTITPSVSLSPITLSPVLLWLTSITKFYPMPGQQSIIKEISGDNYHCIHLGSTVPNTPKISVQLASASVLRIRGELCQLSLPR
ncbi:hypothetical protein DFH05DRAFT_758930 [Lentinula detonsa]|uniref:Uncharacterized protein n=1 Tax=Lentinula detonsa TaxID=2804962 RepID=A0A9W8NPV9_9AGAR|nr:hypothetical protein DFH05DRAFT_758930 [Lentinula detonsa]